MGVTLPRKRHAMTHTDDKQHSRYSENEWAARVELAACYQLADIFGFSDIIWNHITAKIPGTEHFLINRFGLRYDEITASSLITVNIDGSVIDAGNATSSDTVNTTGFIIHSAIHAARHDAHCIFHSHADAGLVISVLKEGLLPMIQDAMLIYGRVSYHDYEGLAVDTDERERLALSLGSNNALILRNHGLLTCGATVGEAFMTMVYLERACKVQAAVLATGREFVLPSSDVCETAARQYAAFPYGHYEWPALLRMLDGRSPDYRS